VTPNHPSPVSAHWTLGPDAQVEFSEHLVQGALNPGNWSLRWANNRYPVLAAAVPLGFPHAFVNLTKGAPVPDPGPDSVSFLAVPPDVVSLATGVPSAPFAGFPMVL